MKASKYTIIVCWILTAISLVAVWMLRCEIDIQLQELLTKTTLAYDYDTRDFYIGIWSNLLSGVIASLILTYVTYFHSKHCVEFALRSSEDSLIGFYNLIICEYYTIDIKDDNFTHISNERFKYDILRAKDSYNRMIEASNDYGCFMQSKKSKILCKGKRETQNIWVEICVVEDSITTMNNDKELRENLCDIRKKVMVHRDILKQLSEDLKNL